LGRAARDGLVRSSTGGGCGAVCTVDGDCAEVVETAVGLSTVAVGLGAVGLSAVGLSTISLGTVGLGAVSLSAIRLNAAASRISVTVAVTAGATGLAIGNAIGSHAGCDAVALDPAIAVGVDGPPAGAPVGIIDEAAPVAAVATRAKLVDGGFDQVFAGVNLVATFVGPLTKVVTRREGKSGGEGGEEVEYAEGGEEVDHLGCCE